MGNVETVDSKASITEHEKDYAVSIIPRGELAGTSRLQPGTTLRRMGEFIPNPVLKERLIAFYADHNPEKDNIPYVSACWEGKDLIKLNEGLRKQYGASLDEYAEGTAVCVGFEQFWEQKGDFTHVCWNLEFLGMRVNDSTGLSSRNIEKHTVKLIHAGITGGACTVFLDGMELGDGRMGDQAESRNMLLPKALYDGGSSFKFPLQSRTFCVDVRLCGSILEEQHYTYHLLMDGRPALPSGAPGTLPARFQDCVNLMKALQPKYELKPDEKLHLYSLYMQATEGPCTLEKPSMMDVAGQEQWTAWNSLEGLSKSAAMAAYCEAAMKQATENSICSLTPIISKESLIFFYHQHDQSGLQRVDSLLKTYTTEQLVSAMVEKFGEHPVLSYTLQEKESALTHTTSPTVETSAPPAPATASDASTKQLPTKHLPITETLVKRIEPVAEELFATFYAKHDRSMLPKVEDLLQSYALPQLLQAMQDKYGEHPGGLLPLPVGSV